MHLEFIKKNPGMLKLVFSDIAVERSPERKKKIFLIVKTYTDKLSAIAEKGRREGEILSDISPEAIAFSMVSFVQHAGLISNITEGKTDLSGLAEVAWGYVERAVRNDRHSG